MVDLEELYLGSNAALGDIQPLIDNTGLGAGDVVDLSDISPALLCSAVAALEARSVAVTYTTCS